MLRSQRSRQVARPAARPASHGRSRFIRQQGQKLKPGADLAMPAARSGYTRAVASTRKKRKRRGRESRNRGGGLMMGMRSGFKKAADATIGTGEPARKKKSRAAAVIGTVVTVALLVAAVALLMRRL
jgi:hypothetical protein